MNQMAELMMQLAKEQGFNQTMLPEVRIFKESEATEVLPFCYEQGLLIVGQGAERIYYKDQVYEYNQHNYLALTVPITAECEVVVTPGEPMLGMAVDFNVCILSSVLDKLNAPGNVDVTKPKHASGLFVANRSPEINDTALRLLKALQSPTETRVLGRFLLEELMFWVLVGQGGDALVELTQKNSQRAKIDRALKWIHSEYPESINVEALSSMVNMSPSVFHRAFKDFTAKSPMQYLKSVRLTRARDILSLGGENVATVAHRVGYESVSQFSREFKRTYGTSPKNVRP